jgi:hypothetical protein
MAANMANQHRWTRVPVLAAWLVASRLDRFAAMSRGVGKHETGKLTLLQRIRELGGQVRAKIPQRLAGGG